MVHFVKRFSSFFSIKVENLVEKMIHQSKIVKSRQGYSNGHLPYHCSFYYLSRIRYVVRICMCSKDGQKQLAGMSLTLTAAAAYSNTFSVE